MAERAVLQNGTGVEVGTSSNPLIVNSNDRVATKTVTFAAATTGAVDAHTIFTVTGFVKAKVLAVCTTNVGIQAGAEISVGIVGALEAFIGATAGDALDAGELWHDTSPDAGIELSSVGIENYLAAGQDIVYDVSVDTLDSGVVTFYCIWEPVSSGATVVAA